ncbi:hypothetical protein DFH08DRAFT_855143 [Mycena albidolilacea]|uniref:Uncharacterized protein n=1 Tax=Mycena albidolilacea TaxID=1033008 RepID=A0AAD7EX04_9AGAR|nr:hypothetical protein DFH08DRAFT_855143 [Mycena albidolilacea]
MLNVLRSVGGIACGRDADPLFTLLQAVEMLERMDFSDGTRVCGLRMCAVRKGKEGAFAGVVWASGGGAGEGGAADRGER